MLNTSLIPKHVALDLLESLGTRQHTSLSDLDSQIAEMSPRDALDAFLTWNGIIGWADTLIETWEALKAAEKEPK